MKKNNWKAIQSHGSDFTEKWGIYDIVGDEMLKKHEHPPRRAGARIRVRAKCLQFIFFFFKQREISLESALWNSQFKLKLTSPVHLKSWKIEL